MTELIIYVGGRRNGLVERRETPAYSSEQVEQTTKAQQYTKAQQCHETQGTTP
ncbi:MAG: hypothetical protein ACQETI_09380 [Halobacteriota archaeon]